MTITILDGGMGQELVARSDIEPTGLWSTQLLIDSPELVQSVHADYFKAGADVATTCSYPVHRDRLAPYDIEDKFELLHQRACEVAVKARDEYGSGMVAGSMGPTGWSYRPDLAPPAEQAAELYGEIARLHEPFVDLLICETMSSVEQARGALMGARVIDKPVWLSISVNDDDGTQLRSEEPVTDILPLVGEFKPAALLINCSVPEAVDQAIPLLVNTQIPIGAYANGFTKISTKFKTALSSVDHLEKREDLNPDKYADFADNWIDQGATIVGGCCEVGPSHIAELTSRFKA